MKRKDLIYLSVAISILIVAGFLLINSGNSKKSGAPTIEVVESIDGEYDQVILAEIANTELHRNFAVPVDLGTELGNPKPFGR